jgi:hypothetical protein
VSLPMDGRDINQAVNEERAMRRRLYELQEAQRWVHHVADLDSGDTQTTPLDRPITPRSRAERFAQLGHPFDPNVLGGVSYRLTPRHPYQPSPQAWLVAHRCVRYSSGENFFVWSFPPDLGPIGSAIFFFAVAPAPRAIGSISLFAQPVFDKLGQLRVQVPGVPGYIEVPLEDWAAYTVDFTFVPPSGQPVWIGMEFSGELEGAAFAAISLGGPAEPVFEG